MKTYNKCRCNVFDILHYVVQYYCLKIYLLNLFRRHHVIPMSAFMASGMLRTGYFPRASCIRVWMVCTSNWSLLISLPTVLRVLAQLSFALGVTWSEGFCATRTCTTPTGRVLKKILIRSAASQLVEDGFQESCEGGGVAGGGGGGVNTV